MAGNLEVAFAVLTRNSADVAEVVDKLGGVIGLMRAAPALLKILKTVNEVNESVGEDEALPLQYGNKTKAKVIAFQKKHGLDPDGIVGDKTWAKAEELLPKVISA